MDPNISLKQRECIMVLSVGLVISRWGMAVRVEPSLLFLKACVRG